MIPPLRSNWSALLLLVGVSCTGPAGPKEAPSPLGDADRILACDLDGDGRDEVITITGGRAVWGEHDVALGGAPSAQARGRIDGADTVVLATGAGRGHADAPARVWTFNAQGATKLWERGGDQSRITDLRIADGRVFISQFGRAKSVEGGWLEAGAFERVHERTMALTQVPLGQGRFAVGRLYGDAPRSNGDLRIVEAGKEDQILPTVRGVRTLATADMDGDGHLDLIVSDGWHFKYGAFGEARLSLYRGPSFTDRRAIASFPGEYTINQITVVPSLEQGNPQLIAVGTKQVHRVSSDPMGWKVLPLGSTTETTTGALFTDGSERWFVVSGRPSEAFPILPAI